MLTIINIFIMHCSFILLFQYNAKAEDTLLIGNKYSYEFLNVEADSIVWEILIENPTLIFIDSISFNSEMLPLQRISIDTIQFHTFGNGSLKVCISPLAGSDSTTYFIIHKYDINKRLLADTTFRHFIRSSFTPLPYIRIASLSDNMPNPVLINESTQWNYYLDQPSTVTIDIVDLCGRILYTDTFYKEKAGSYSWVWTVRPYIQSAGIYFLHFRSNLGDIVKKWNVSP